MAESAGRTVTSSGGTALVTGAAGTLGTHIVGALAARVDAIAINDIDADAADRLRRAVSECEAAVFPGDVADPAAASTVVGSVVDRYGAIDILVNAAGIEGPVAAVEDLVPEDVIRVFEVNVLSMFWMCSASVPGLKDRAAGRIVNIASGAGLAGGALTSPYNASKHAVVGLTRSLARELGPFGIAVNAVCPGYVASPMVERIATREAQITGRLPDYSAAVPMGRFATPGEVAATVGFLAMDAPAYVTGTCLVLDGGLRA
jgi:NAD(P)-dependent dehydrogenase (short-subunit alcohol dehydrogenase family)